MEKHVGYQDALRLAKKEIETRKPEDIINATKAKYAHGQYIIPWYGQDTPLDEGSLDEQIIWYHYLLASGPKKPLGEHINYRQVPGANIYYDNFLKRAVYPMVGGFADHLDRFLKAGLALGGKKESLAHASFTITPLPYIPITYLIWQGDDEMPANGTILFDAGAVNWLCAEDLVVLAGLPVYRMLGMKDTL